MRVSIPKGYRAPIEKLMQQLQTDDPALAVNHVIGCWLASNGCPGQSPVGGAALAPAAHVQSPAAAAANDDEFSTVAEW